MLVSKIERSDCKMLEFCKKQRFFDKLYTEMFPYVLRTINHYVYNVKEAEDIMQETFLEAYRHLDKLLVHENPKGWLLVTARIKVMKYWDANKKRLSREILQDFHEREGYSEGYCDEYEFLTLSAIEQLLTPDEYLLFKKKFLEECSYESISEELQISMEACRVRVMRLRKKLQQNLGEALMILWIFYHYIFFTK